MSFCIGRVDHYKMSSVNGVFREASRSLFRYPNDVDIMQSWKNVILEQAFNPALSVSQQIRDFKDANAIGGRFDEVRTNVMCQAFFKLDPDFLRDLSEEDVTQAYQDLLDWLKERYPTIVVVGAYIHHDEPNAGVHMHVNFLPLYRDEAKDRTIFATSRLFEGKQHFLQFQDDLHAFACSHFGHNFLRKRPCVEKAKHLSVPEYKEAMRELDAIRERIDAYKPTIATLNEVEQMGRETIFSSGYKLTKEEYDTLTTMACSSVSLTFRVSELEKDLQDAHAALRRERLASRRLAHQVRSLQDVVKRLWRFLYDLGGDFYRQAFQTITRAPRDRVESCREVR